VREEVAGRRLKNGEASARHKKDRRDDQQQPAAGDDRSLLDAVIIACQNNILIGRNPARSEYGSSRRPSSGQL
jgi:hypothetical protein